MDRIHTPNILLIISDQQRVETLGHMRRTPCRTPNIDHLASTGVSFTRCVTPSPLCAPARCGLFTGRYPHQVGAWRPKQAGTMANVQTSLYDNDDVSMLMNACSPTDPMPFCDPLHESGYVLDYVGKWHLGDENLPKYFDRYEANSVSDWPEGAENWAFFSDARVVTKSHPRMSIPTAVVDDLPADRSIDAWIAEVAIEHLKNRQKDRPFFLTCGYIGPHPPFKVPEPYFSMYDHRDLPEPENFKPNERERECNSVNYYRRICEEFGATWEDWQKSYAAYWGFCTHIDYQTGRILGALDEEGLTENTLVIYCSDHGELLGTHGLWQKYEPYEEDIRVPLVFSAPWLEHGVQSEATVSLLDLIPTILSHAGAAPPNDLQGIDLTELLSTGDEDITSGRYVFSEHKPLGSFHNTVDWRMVTDNHWKYVLNNGDLDELFNLDEDPHEIHNLIDLPEAAGEQSRLETALLGFMESTADPLHVF